jgi:Domain of unknown function (DUF4265)
MTADTDNLTKVHIDLPNHWWFKGESLWAKSLGNDLYEIQNIPFCAYGLNCRDVVIATADAPDLKPEIRAVVRRSGNKTIRVFFDDEILKDQQQPYLEKMQSLGAWFERAKPSVVCINVEATADYDFFCKHLIQLESNGILEYETCEERILGSFDDLPESEQEDGT